ncbi:hypothetical protein [Mucilaginibacter sp.]|uniref:hypothetical protein n=1 Tax=Mucilaginibacter sp. TaxID=1882438 RepID=UPI0035BC2FCE
MKKYLLGATAIVLAIGASAFTTNNANTLYKFNGNSSTMHDASAYQVVTTPPAGCGGSALPCYVSITGDLQSWLDARTDAQIVADAPARKN